MHRRSDLETKIVILGLSQSGKTSIRQVIFEGYAPEATSLNPATVRINRKLFNLAGSNLNIFDVGGQSNYLNEVFTKYQERTFTGTRTILFVVDVSDASNIMRSKYYFDQTIKAAKKYGDESNIFVFVHKMDNVPIDKREGAIESVAEIFEIPNYTNVAIYGTSIYEESLLKAMQKVLAEVFPKDDTKTTKIKGLVKEYNLNMITISTEQGLSLYSHPGKIEGINFSKLHTELIELYKHSGELDYLSFYFIRDEIFVKEIEKDIILTVSFEPDYAENKKIVFNKIQSEIRSLFKPEEVLGKVKEQMKPKMREFFKAQGAIIEDLDRKLNRNIKFRCDVCGRSFTESLLDIGLSNSDDLSKAINTTNNSFEVHIRHECIDGPRSIELLLDKGLDLRTYRKSKSI